jgi:hypothetical protein
MAFRASPSFVDGATLLYLGQVHVLSIKTELVTMKRQPTEWEKNLCQLFIGQKVSIKKS